MSTAQAEACMLFGHSKGGQSAWIEWVGCLGSCRSTEITWIQFMKILLNFGFYNEWNEYVLEDLGQRCAIS